MTPPRAPVPGYTPLLRCGLATVSEAPPVEPLEGADPVPFVYRDV